MLPLPIPILSRKIIDPSFHFIRNELYSEHKDHYPTAAGHKLTHNSFNPLRSAIALCTWKRTTSAKGRVLLWLKTRIQGLELREERLSPRRTRQRTSDPAPVHRTHPIYTFVDWPPWPVRVVLLQQDGQALKKSARSAAKRNPGCDHIFPDSITVLKTYKFCRVSIPLIFEKSGRLWARGVCHPAVLFGSISN